MGIAVVTGRGWQDASIVPAEARRLASLGRLAAAVVYGQVVLGAFTTHGTAVWWHVAGAVVVTGVLIGTALAVLRGAREDPILAWWARAVKVLVLGQLLLGLGAYARSVHESLGAGRAARRRRPAGRCTGRWARSSSGARWPSRSS